MKSLSLPKPHLIVVLGVPGSGKTFFAEQFAKTFHTPYVHYDKIIKLSGSSATAGRKLAAYQINELLKTKQSIIFEGFSNARSDRSELAKIANSAGYETLIVWVQTEPIAAKHRATKPSTDSTSRAISPSQYDEAVRSFVPPHASESVVVISGKHTYASQAKVVLKKLTAPHAELVARTALVRNSEPTLLQHSKAKTSPVQPSDRRNISVK